jgi:hypothetical protein
MARVFRHPALPDYFEEISDVKVGAPARSIVPQYEQPKVLLFPNLKLDIDVNLWASLDTDEAPIFKKLMLKGDPPRVASSDPYIDPQRERIEQAAARMFEQIMPIYHDLFSPYEFLAKQTVCRLNNLKNLAMHIDSYSQDIPTHHARMFINLDNQPRIWQTSWRIQDVFERFADSIHANELATMSDTDLWNALRYRNFGADPKEWWDAQPRHVVFLDPGDVWIVDSRQVAHQIFYGRRCLTIDFTVDRASMIDPTRHYLGLVQDFRRMRLEQVAEA